MGVAPILVPWSQRAVQSSGHGLQFQANTVVRHSEPHVNGSSDVAPWSSICNPSRTEEAAAHCQLAWALSGPSNRAEMAWQRHAPLHISPLHLGCAPVPSSCVPTHTAWAVRHTWHRHTRARTHTRAHT